MTASSTSMRALDIFEIYYKKLHKMAHYQIQSR